jgi:4-hydroxythreonine-4-phosphate dehydrogenase
VPPTIAVTVGDPSGIGPEIALKAAADPRVTAVCRVVLYGPQTEASLTAFPAGEVSAASGRAAFEAILEAVDDARAGRVDALATAPINKAAFHAAGLPWKGHTDLLAHLCGVSDVAMMFWSAPLKVVLATIHIPITDVPRALTRHVVSTHLRLVAESLPRFGVPAPRIAVAGLNPHAGEGGLMGTEDESVIAPAVVDADLERLRP